MKIFISSVQKEFAAERQALGEYLSSDPMLRRFAEPLYLAEYIERIGSGTTDMIRLCREAGLPEPSFSISDGFVATLYRPVASNPPSDLHPRTKFRDQALNQLLADQLIEPTIPDKPTSSNQRYRQTAKGRHLLATLGKPEERP